MPRIAPLPRERLGYLEEQFKQAEREGREIPNFVRTLAHRPEIQKAHSALRLAIIGPGTVDRELKNLVAQMASASAGCNYCWAHNAGFADDMGIPEAKLDAFWDYERSPLYSPAERAALTVARGASVVPNAVTDADFTELKRHFSDEQIVEIVAVIALFGFLNRFNDTMATTLEERPINAATRYLAPHGWAVGKHGA